MKIVVVKYLLWVQDMDRAVRFWSETFGGDVLTESEHWSEIRIGGSAILGLHGGGDGGEVESQLSIQVTDAEGACAEIAAQGGRIVSAPVVREGEPIKLASVADTEGNLFSITEWVG